MFQYLKFPVKERHTACKNYLDEMAENAFRDQKREKTSEVCFRVAVRPREEEPPLISSRVRREFQKKNILEETTNLVRT